MKKIVITGNDNISLQNTAVNEYISTKNSLNEKDFLVFILQRTDKLIWKKTLKKDFQNNIYSYFAFIQNEIKLNWNLLKENFSNTESPIFLTYDSSQTLMTKLIEFFKGKGELKEVAFSNEELAQKMLSNLYYLSTGNIPFSLFSKLIKNQSFSQKIFREETYESLNKLLEVYLSRTLKLGVFDYPSSLYFFNNFLLENEVYLETLKNIKKIIVFDYQCQIPCLDKFLSKFENISLYNNKQGAYGIYFPNSKKNNRLLDEFKIIENHKEDIFLENFYRNIFLGQKNSLSSNKVKIKKDFQDSSEIKQYLATLLKKAKDKNLKNIVILSPSRNMILTNNLEKFCEEEHLSFLNLDKNEKYLDNPYIYALCSLGIIYFNYGKLYLNSDEFTQILVLLLKFNIFKGRDLSKKLKIEKDFLEKLKKTNLENENISIFHSVFNNNYLNTSEFFLALLEHKDKLDIEIVKALEKLLDLSRSFFNNISIFQNIKDVNLEFFISLRKGLKESETLDELHSKIDFKGISLGTPSSFLKLSKEVDLTVFIDINNNLWNINFVNVIQNPFLLNFYFKDKNYDYENDLSLKNEELFNLISRISFLTKNNIVFLGTQSYSDSLLNTALIK